MRAVIMRGAGNPVVTEVPDPQIEAPTDATIRIDAACVCGSDLWPYRGLEDAENLRMGHEYVGHVVEVGAEVSTLTVGDYVVGSFVISCGECEICRAGYQSRCRHASFVHGGIGTQAEYARIPFADGTLVALPGKPDDAYIPSLLAASDVLGTGWFAADAAGAAAGKTIAVVGDGAVGLMGVLGAREMGAERIIISSRHPQRQALAREFGATDVIEERGDDAAERIRELTDGLGAHGTVEAVGTQESMMQAIASTRPGGKVGYVGVSHGVEIPGIDLFFSLLHLHGGPAPVRRYLPDLIERILSDQITPGRVFDRELSLDEAPEAYRAMDQREAVKVLLRP
ncbi:alcohol dehydrogenase catalytic domain-containing protein [Nanchangia anserum]|uniref:Alcohol dehydrogenase catalytic domain-containing protein n=1 Tax=Nanchangia anserum TaxID=2692125 RepID=A0A8I0G724_9ACTO|nr:alcohol dehydrogenase catalytic domain-containing protein [Nanchangia anserum]MBD3689025.1 alcohol dehydrogenase catalytic domain-containing protein [Nanchangia anserum]QOX81269.1 alcohol dehydrogenase catalytic domain-containing protein [Nanchangia anserum]